MKSTAITLLVAVLIVSASAQSYKTTQLGGLGGNISVGFDVNMHGQVTGESTVANGNVHAFLWTKSGGMQDLGTLGGDFSSGQAINGSGQVVGDANVKSGDALHAFR